MLVIHGPEGVLFLSQMTRKKPIHSTALQEPAQEAHSVSPVKTQIQKAYIKQFRNNHEMEKDDLY